MHVGAGGAARRDCLPLFFVGRSAAHRSAGRKVRCAACCALLCIAVLYWTRLYSFLPSSLASFVLSQELLAGLSTFGHDGVPCRCRWWCRKTCVGDNEGDRHRMAKDWEGEGGLCFFYSGSPFSFPLFPGRRPRVATLRTRRIGLGDAAFCSVSSCGTTEEGSRDAFFGDLSQCRATKRHRFA